MKFPIVALFLILNAQISSFSEPEELPFKVYFKVRENKLGLVIWNLNSGSVLLHTDRHSGLKFEVCREGSGEIGDVVYRSRMGFGRSSFDLLEGREPGSTGFQDNGGIEVPIEIPGSWKLQKGDKFRFTLDYIELDKLSETKKNGTQGLFEHRKVVTVVVDVDITVVTALKIKSESGG